ncbi:MAG: hypothetical protein Q4E76_01730 [Tissierellia bacterium]|nr:hypothetical protein [Tissierellia bacterium]
MTAEFKEKFNYVMAGLFGLCYGYLLSLIWFNKVGSIQLIALSFVLFFMYNGFSHLVIFSGGKRWLLFPYLLIQVGIFAQSLVVYLNPGSVELVEGGYWLSTVRLQMVFAVIAFFVTLYRYMKLRGVPKNSM